jgi:hypothetical protein
MLSFGGKDGPPDHLWDLRDNGVAKGLEAGGALWHARSDARYSSLPRSVQPAGKPIMASTHGGLSEPLPSVACILWSSLSFSRLAPVLRVSAAGLDPLNIDAVGVGHILT